MVKKLSKEHKMNLSKSLMGRKVSIETRIKISMSNMGKKHSEESKKKMSVSHMGQKSWNKGTKGICKPNSGSFKKGNVPYSKGKCNVDKICIGCKKKFTVLKCYKKKYCTQKCYLKDFVPACKGTKGIMKPNSGSFKKGCKPWSYIDGRSKFLGPGRYGDDWNKIRLIIYKRDNYLCQECGVTMNETKRAHHIHHKVPFLTSFDNSLNNLITLCPSCHRREEARLFKKMKMGVIIRS